LFRKLFGTPTTAGKKLSKTFRQTFWSPTTKLSADEALYFSLFIQNFRMVFNYHRERICYSKIRPELISNFITIMQTFLEHQRQTVLLLVTQKFAK
jgi:hypothetical protein